MRINRVGVWGINYLLSSVTSPQSKYLNQLRFKPQGREDGKQFIYSRQRVSMPKAGVLSGLKTVYVILCFSGDFSRPKVANAGNRFFSSRVTTDAYHIWKFFTGGQWKE